MTEQIKHFLLVFDHAQGQFVDERHFGTDQEAALGAYEVCEREHRHEPMIDIVLVGSDAIETVRVTHANHFDGAMSVSKYLAGM